MTTDIQKERSYFEGRLLGHAGFVVEGLKIDNDTPRERLLLAMGGIGGECGEVVDEIKKLIFHGKSEGEVVDKLIEEMGDLMWYLLLLSSTMGIDWNDILDKNHAKLVARYPERHPHG